MDKLPPAKLIDVDGASLEYITAGTGLPTVVLINGAGGPLAGWGRIWTALAERTSVLAYNRAGIGRSSKPAQPQVGSFLVSSLATLLQRAGQTSPYVLVGHSLGGLIVNLFARTHPTLVSGVVLLEATAPDDPDLMAKYSTRLQRTIRRLLEAVWPSSPLAETAHVEATIAELRQAPSFPAVPLTVVTGTRPALRWATASEVLASRAEHQRQLARLSPLGRQVEATRSGHFPQLTEPELVTLAVAQIVDRVRQAG